MAEGLRRIDGHTATIQGLPDLGYRRALCSIADRPGPGLGLFPVLYGGPYQVRWTKHSTFSFSLPSTSTNAFVANYVVGMLCFGQHREPLEQEER